MRLIIGFALVLLFSGCGVFGPPAVKNNVGQQASWDGTEQNSGIDSTWPAGAKGKDVKGFLVTSHFNARYEGLIAKYGNRFDPPVTRGQGIKAQPDGWYVINQQAMVWFLDMNQWNNNDRITK
jgi:hypothetical protein